MSREESTTPDPVELTRDAFDAASRTDLDAHALDAVGLEE